MLLKKEKKIEKPAEGDYKITLHYAWWPVRTKQGVIWLERYKKIWLYSVRIRYIDMHLALVPLVCGDWDLMEVKRYARIIPRKKR